MPAFQQIHGGAHGPDGTDVFAAEPERRVDERASRPPPVRPGDPQKKAGPDPAEIARAAADLFEGMKGLGTDERMVLTALQGRGPEEIQALRAPYEKRYGRSLDAELSRELGGKDLQAAQAAMAGDPVAAAAATLEAAVAGLGSDAELVHATLRALPDEEHRKKVAEEVRRRTGKSIGDLLDDELRGANREQAQLLLAGKRADADALRLVTAMKGLGTDEEAVHATLEGAKTREELDAIVAAYEARTGRSLDADIFKEMSGAHLDLATWLAVGDQAGGKAARARLAMDGPGTDEHMLRRSLEGTSVEEAESVREKYAEGGGDIDRDLHSELSGSERLDIGTMLPKPVGPAFGSEAFESLLDETTGSKAREGNQVDMLFDGVEAFPERMKMIDQATDSINLQTFIFNDDDTGWAIATKLAAKAKEGVKVRVIYDAVGSGRADPKMFDLMREHGVEVREYAPILKDPLSINNRTHEKQLIIDGKASIQGGMNIADEYALGGSGNPVFSRGGSEAWRDADIRLEGPAVGDAQAAFLKQWNDLGEDVPKDEAEQMMKAPPPVEGGTSVRVVHHRPDQDGDDNIENLYLNCIRSSQTSITIENAYLLPSEEIRAELIAAAKRGVKVRVMTNSRESTDTKPVADASRFYYDDLVAAGVEVHEKSGGTLHSKTAAFDGAYSIVGSANLNSRSREHDAEIVLAVQDPGVAQQLEQRFDQGLDESDAVTMKELASEDPKANAKQWLFSRASGLM
jgi:cardiolipin synthase A/B